jgi:hypothetical protein
VIAAFTLALFAGTAAIAAWIVTRFPGLAPKSLQARVGVAACSLILLELAPITDAAPVLLYLTVFTLAVVLLAVWLSALWMMQSVRDLLG